MAQVDFFLKVDGAPGESPADKHEGEIEVQSFTWGVHNLGSSQHGGGAGSGRSQASDYSFVKMFDKASPKLMEMCCNGSHIPKIVLTCRKAGKDQQEYLKVEFSDAFVSSYQVGGSSGGGVIPTDSISLNFSKIEMTYKEQKKDGTLGGSTQGKYDFKKVK